MSSPDDRQSYVWNLARVGQEHGDRIAVETADGIRLTYAQFWQRVGELGNLLEGGGVCAGDTVAIRLPRSPDFVAGIVAAWTLNAVALPMDVQMPELRQQQILAEAKPRLVLQSPLLPGGAVTTVTIPDTDPAARAYLIYTSGSSGRPKGVLVSHAGLVPILKQQIEMFRITPHSRCLWMHGPGFDASLSDIGTALLAGATLCFDAAKPYDPGLIKRMGITHVDLPPALLSCLDEGTMVETIVIGGEVCAPEVVRKWAARTRLINVYGPTEATICTSMVVCDPEWNRAWIGAPAEGISYQVCDDEGGETDTGELRISGAAVALGYPWLPELSAQRFVDGGRTYRTGDRVRKHGDGRYEFLGRADRQFKLRGRLLCPEEVEQALRETGLTNRVRVLPLPRRTRTLLAAAVESAAPASALSAALRERLPDWMIPNLWIVRDSLPMLSNGKPDDVAIRALPLQNLAAAPVLQRTPDEDLIHELFVQSLEVADAGMNEDFFDDLGGDSLAAVTLMAMAAERGIPLAADAVHRGRTISGVARLLRERSSEAMSREDLEHEAVLDFRFVTAPAEPPRCLLLTGATGFLGTALLPELNATVIPLSRRNGDVRRERFGWDPDKWRRMADEVDTVVHLAADVKLLAPYGELKASQVDGTRHVLAFCAEGRPKTLHFASTLSVFVDADPLESWCREDDWRRGITHIHGGYAQSKWVAEQLVLNAREQGLRAAIHRLGLLSLHSLTGAGPAADWLTLALPGLLNQPPDPALAFDLTPVDYAARVMAWIICQAGEGIYHIAAPEPVSAARLAGLGEARASAFAALAGRRTHRSLDLFKCSRVRFDRRRTEAALAGSGIGFPEITSEYLLRCLRHAESTRP